MNAFLNSQEMVCLTGYVRRADQIRWLNRNGIAFLVNAKGDPVVSADVLNALPSSRYELGEVR